MKKLTKQERAEYKNLIFTITCLRTFLRADFKLSYKREKNNKLFYYLSVYNYIITYKDNKAKKYYTSTYTRYNTYERINLFLLTVSHYYTQLSKKELKKLLEAEHNAFNKPLRLLSNWNI